jgi:aspartate kinase
VSVDVLKIGGSVLTGPLAYRHTAAFLCRLASTGRRPIVAVVSAEKGHTEALLDEARRFAGDPERAPLDLLWSTGELRSVALLTLSLRQAGVLAAGFNAHEAGLVALSDRIDLNPIAIRAALTRHSVVVVPGFLATRDQQVVTLGRGGSDLSAVVIAAGLRAARCVLIKDVDGYFTADPTADPTARLIPRVRYDEALRMADAGCPLVQRDALLAGRDAGIDIVVRSLTSEGSVVGAVPSFTSSAIHQLTR